MAKHRSKNHPEGSYRGTGIADNAKIGTQVERGEHDERQVANVANAVRKSVAALAGLPNIGTASAIRGVLGVVVIYTETDQDGNKTEDMVAVAEKALERAGKVEEK